jgi:hypothetical protein
VGDVWDFFFRAHSRNLALLKSRMVGAEVIATPQTRARDGLVVAGALVAFLTALAVPVTLLVLVVSTLTR